MSIFNPGAEARSRYLAKIEAQNRDYRATIARVKALRDTGPWIYNDWGDKGICDEALELALKDGA